MKKQIAFYIGWDVIFIIYLRLYNASDIWMLNYMRNNYRGGKADFLPSILMDIGLLIGIGVIIFLLVYTSFQFELTRRLAILELAIIGIPSTFLATLIVMRYLAHMNVLEHFNENLPSWLHWVYYSSSTDNYFTIGSILLGYELILFIVRIIKCTKAKIPSESE